ncbi:helicase-associated domain-containing protein [Pseudonocardia nigra]|uniref:helicase-associated domain-containing protein n=1 Tax=Pseudonocardia nigra TaxID=1921578 RepID=UPI001C5FF33B|nr:helicase-associated domain-containing protein [Pseudonocardia nigra]
MSFAQYLGRLDAGRLTALLQHRPDVLVEPVPRTVEELAFRLNGVESLLHAMRVMNRDEVAVARLIAMLGEADLATLASRLRAPEAEVRQVVDGLCGRGLAWALDARLGLPERLAEHFAAGLAHFRPLAHIARQSRVHDLKTAVEGLGGDPSGLRKPELVELLDALVRDPVRVAAALTDLPPPARHHLEQLCRADGMYFFGGMGGGAGPLAVLARSGLMVAGQYGRAELPREVAVHLLLGDGHTLTGRPQVPPSADAPDDGRAGAEAAVLALTTLLDETRSRPLPALKKGGVGARERKRLGTRLAMTDPALWIDLADATGLLTAAPEGYRATAGYDGWREAEPALRWARVALAWFGLDLAPTSRETDDGEVPPPLPLESAAGMLRRALLRAAAEGRSVRAAGEQVDWFCPLHQYDEVGRARKVGAAVQEAALLGVIVGDRLSALGEHLVAVAGRPDAVEELARRCADLLPEARGLLVLQSDLTAVVSGQPSAAAARLLAATATPENRGTATTWRFTPESVRAALDAGWTADELLSGLAAISGQPLPQPLDYLITDVARRHGSVRVRGSRSCIVGTEPEITEILHTRSLRTLHLSRLAPTVLTSPFELDDVLARLRAAGFAPMAEDADGVAIVPERTSEAPPAVHELRPRARARLAAPDLAARLLAAGSAPPVQASPSHAELANLAPRLDAAEVALLAHALDGGHDVRIIYRNKEGNRTVRDIQPRQLYGRWLNSWCHLRSGEREFAVAGIEAVGPVG